MTGRPRSNLTLTPDERKTLENWSRRRSTPQDLTLRAKIILACSQHLPNIGVAAQLGVSRDTVGKWRSRFIAAGLAGLQDAPRPGAPRRITDLQVGEVIRRTEEAPGPGAGKAWSTRSLAAKMGISQSTVSRIWRAHGLQPKRGRVALPPSEAPPGPVEPARPASPRPANPLPAGPLLEGPLLEGPLLAGQAVGIVGMFLYPPEKCLVLCADMGARPPGIATSLGEDAGSRAGLPAPDDAGDPRSHRRHQEFLRFLRRVDEAVPADLDVQLICDRRLPHPTATVRDWLRARPRYRVHLTTAAASWLAMFEWWFTELAHRHADGQGAAPQAVAWIAAGGG